MKKGIRKQERVNIPGEDIIEKERWDEDEIKKAAKIFSTETTDYMVIHLPAGKMTLTLDHQEPPSRIVGAWISLFALLAAACLVWATNNRKIKLTK